VVRFAWHMPFNAVVRWRTAGAAFILPAMLRPSVGSGLVISWQACGHRHARRAMALPPEFPYRDLILLTAFAWWSAR